MSVVAGLDEAVVVATDTPSVSGWARLAQALACLELPLPDGDAERLDRALDAWPDALRDAPPAWIEAAAAGRPPPALRWVRSIRLPLSIDAPKAQCLRDCDALRQTTALYLQIPAHTGALDVLLDAAWVRGARILSIAMPRSLPYAVQWFGPLDGLDDEALFHRLHLGSRLRERLERLHFVDRIRLLGDHFEDFTSLDLGAVMASGADAWLDVLASPHREDLSAVFRLGPRFAVRADGSSDGERVRAQLIDVVRRYAESSPGPFERARPFDLADVGTLATRLGASPRDVVELLCSALEDGPTPSARASLLWALCRVSAPDAKISATLRRAGREIVGPAMRWLLRYDHAGAVDLAVDVLEDPSASPRLVRAVLTSLERDGAAPAEFEPRLLRALHQSLSTRKLSAVASQMQIHFLVLACLASRLRLAALEASVRPRLRKPWDAGTRAMLVALGRRELMLSERFVRVAMTAATRDGARKDRRVAARALGHYASIASVRPFVETLARDPDPQTAKAAQRALES